MFSARRLLDTMMIKPFYLLTLGILLPACGLSSEQPMPTITLTEAPIASPTLSRTATLTITTTPSYTPTRKSSTTPTFNPSLSETPLSTSTPTFSPPTTRTPAPAAQCPPLDEQPSEIKIDKIEFLTTQIQDYLNRRGSALGLQEALNQVVLPKPEDASAHLEAQTFVKDVTGDTVLDVVIDVHHSDRGDLLIYSCTSGKYRLLVTPSWSVIYAGLFAIVDMNQNGVPEVVYQTQDCGAGCVTGFNFLEWDGENFVELSEPGGPYGEPSIWGGSGEIRDIDGNGTLELILSGDWSPRYGPGRARHDIWMWNGRALAFYRSYYDPPVFRLQAIFDGDDAFQEEDYASALASYQRAIFDESLIAWGPDQNSMEPRQALGDPDERQELSAYARYHILLLHIVQGHWQEANTVFDTLQSKFPAGSVGRQYAELAAAFWTEYQTSQNISNACGKVVEYASFHQEEILVPLDWPSDNESSRIQSPEDICPFK